LLSECGDERARALYVWRAARSDDEKTAAQDRFLRLHGYWQSDQELGRLNYLNDLRWPVDREWPQPPEPADYALSLKEFEFFAKRASGFLRSKNLGL
jgi:hypothetical protein